MTNLITKIKTAASNAIVFAAGIFLAALGLAFVGTMALFGLVAVGVAMIAACFVMPADRADDNVKAPAQ